MTDLDRQANVLGALALIVTDRTAEAIVTAVGEPLSGTTAAALSALHHFLDQPSIDRLRQVLGLTPSGTVRLVDRLVEASLVTRGPGRDGRSRVITLTENGQRIAEQITAARAAVLSNALNRLPADDRSTLEELMGRLLAGFVRGPGATRWGCRLCDTQACERDQGRCPIAGEAAVTSWPTQTDTYEQEERG